MNVCQLFKIESVKDLRKNIGGCLALQSENFDDDGKDSKPQLSIHERIKEYEEYYGQLEEENEITI